MTLERLEVMARAVEDNWAAAWASLGAVAADAPTHADTTPTLTRVYTPGAPEPLLNAVLRYSAPGPITADAVAEVIAPFQQYGLPLQWWVLLGAEPAGLRDQLRALGMQTWGGSTAMALALDGWAPVAQAPSGVDLVRISADGDDGVAALRLIARVFSVPPDPMRRWTLQNRAFQLYGARWEGRLVSVLAILAHQRVAGVYNVATLPGMRRRGIAGSLVAHALGEAREKAECAWATLTATPEARHLYESLGFRTCGFIEQWMPGPRLMRSLLRAQDSNGYLPGWGW